jgi:hypothetical protein
VARERVDRGVAVTLGIASVLFAAGCLLGSATLPGQPHQPSPGNCGTAFGVVDESDPSYCQDKQQRRALPVGLLLFVATAIAASALTSAVSGWRGNQWPLPDALLMVGLPLVLVLSLTGFVYWATLSPSGE